MKSLTRVVENVDSALRQIQSSGRVFSNKVMVSGNKNNYILVYDVTQVLPLCSEGSGVQFPSTTKRWTIFQLHG